MRFLVIAGCIAAFLLSNGILDLLGWHFTADVAPAFVKIHPATYLFAATAVYAAFGPGEQRLFSLPKAFFFYAAAAVMALFATLLSQMAGRSSGGEQSGAIVTFITPIFVILTLMMLNERDKSAIAIGLRVLFMANSILAIVEQFIGGRVVPTFLDLSALEWRSGALLGHPLLNALLTGLLVVYLATASNRSRPFRWYIPELFLHGVAMFCFGGRAALIGLPAALLYHAVFGGGARQRPTAALIRRFAPILIGAALVTISALPFSFVQSSLARFSNDRGSADTRLAALRMIGRIDTEGLLFGVAAPQRKVLMHLYDTPLGIEIAWAALTLTYGLLVTMLLAIGLLWLLASLTRRIDRSGRAMAVYFLMVTAVSLSIGTKSMLISQLIIMLFALSGSNVRPLPQRRRGPLVQFAGRHAMPHVIAPVPARTGDIRPVSPFFGRPLRRERRPKTRRLSHPTAS